MGEKPVYKEILISKILLSAKFSIREGLGPQQTNLAGEAKSKLKPIDIENISSMENSINELGLLQNVIVRETTDGHYDLLAGHRRLKAIRRKGFDKEDRIPALVFPPNTRDFVAMKVALAENAVRERVSLSEFGDFIIGMVRQELSEKLALDSSEDVDEDAVIAAMWAIHDKLYPVGSIPFELSGFLQEFVDKVQSSLMHSLDGTKLELTTFMLDVLPVTVDESLREEYEHGDVNINDIRFFAKLNREQAVREAPDEDVTEVKDDKTEKERKKVSASASAIMKGLLSHVTEDDKQDLLNDARERFIDRYSVVDFDKSAYLRDKAENLKIKREQLSLVNIPKSRKREIQDSLESANDAKQVAEEIVKEQFAENEVNDFDTLMLKEIEGSILEDKIKFDNLSVESKRSIAEDTIRTFLEPPKPKAKKDKDGKDVLDYSEVKMFEDILSVCYAEAIEKMFEEVTKILGVKRDEGTNALVNNEGDIGMRNQIRLRCLGLFYRWLGEGMLKRYKSVQDDKKGTLIDAMENMNLFFNFKINRETKKEGIVS